MPQEELCKTNKPLVSLSNGHMHRVVGQGHGRSDNRVKGIKAFRGQG